MQVAQHLWDLETLQRATLDEAAKDASAQHSLCLGRSLRINAADRVGDHAWRCVLPIKIRHLLKHPIDHTDVEMRVLVRLEPKR